MCTLCVCTKHVECLCTSVLGVQWCVECAPTPRTPDTPTQGMTSRWWSHSPLLTHPRRRPSCSPHPTSPLPPLLLLLLLTSPDGRENLRPPAVRRREHPVTLAAPTGRHSGQHPNPAPRPIVPYWSSTGLSPATVVQLQ